MQLFDQDQFVIDDYNKKLQISEEHRAYEEKKYLLEQCLLIFSPWKEIGKNWFEHPMARWNVSLNSSPDTSKHMMMATPTLTLQCLETIYLTFNP